MASTSNCFYEHIHTNIYTRIYVPIQQGGINFWKFKFSCSYSVIFSWMNNKKKNPCKISTESNRYNATPRFLVVWQNKCHWNKKNRNLFFQYYFWQVVWKLCIKLINLYIFWLISFISSDASSSWNVNFQLCRELLKHCEIKISIDSY